MASTSWLYPPVPTVWSTDLHLRGDYPLVFQDSASLCFAYYNSVKLLLLLYQLTLPGTNLSLVLLLSFVIEITIKEMIANLPTKLMRYTVDTFFFFFFFSLAKLISFTKAHIGKKK